MNVLESYDNTQGANRHHWQKTIPEHGHNTVSIDALL